MTAGSRGQSLELYFINGKPDGMLTAEVFNWTGHVLMTPRTQISEALKRPEAQFTGVYLLFGENDGKPCAYIGEGEDMSYRIRSHEARKDWWTQAILVTTQANSLNKAHIRYLEARLIEEARNIARVGLDNGTAPTLPSLKEAERANMEGFLDYLLMVLPAIGIDAFKQNKRPKLAEASKEDITSPIFELHTRKHDLRARALIEDGDFVVLEGSEARPEWGGKGSELTSYAKLHGELLGSGVLTIAGPKAKFTQNFAFASPSAAGAVVNGRPTNGTIEWKIEGSSKTYKDWEAERLEASE
ncbi:GIY-YIG nuclease family protein [Thalassospira lucentensis]|uniref:GIY-YIG nuclease family protein n=1 Tax=Thalassospira lucentensis TaxID=168935 RepID=UPI002942D200|nr:GIY-YIG nuclease family protein [Thalassospira lucentensis]WOI12644.1 GIY-YIG nuclease family protein [Thalassospira lucentensis]